MMSTVQLVSLSAVLAVILADPSASGATMERRQIRTPKGTSSTLLPLSSSHKYKTMSPKEEPGKDEAEIKDETKTKTTRKTTTRTDNKTTKAAQAEMSPMQTSSGNSSVVPSAQVAGSETAPAVPIILTDRPRDTLDVKDSGGKPSGPAYRNAVNHDSEDYSRSEHNQTKFNVTQQGCNMECSHGGYCTVRRELDDLAADVRSGNLIEVCVCPLGYTGLACDELVDQCQYPSRTCHNGMPCSLHNDGSGEENYSCDCALADSISDFAGRMCRNPITEYCGNTRYRFKGDDMPDSFCTNGGRCRSDFLTPSDSYTLSEATPATQKGEGDAVFADESHQDVVVLPYQHRGCVCPPEFFGPHCEFIRLQGVTFNMETEINVNNDPKAVARTIVRSSFFVALIAFFACVGSLLLLKFRQIRRRRRNRHWAARAMRDHDAFNMYDVRHVATSTRAVMPPPSSSSSSQPKPPRRVAPPPEQDMRLWNLIQSSGLTVTVNRILANAQGAVEEDVVSDLDNLSDFYGPDKLDNDDSSGMGNSNNTSLPPMISESDDDVYCPSDMNGEPLHIYEEYHGGDDDYDEPDDSELSYDIPHGRIV